MRTDITDITLSKAANLAPYESYRTNHKLASSLLALQLGRHLLDCP